MNFFQLVRKGVVDLCEKIKDLLGELFFADFEAWVHAGEEHEVFWLFDAPELVGVQEVDVFLGEDLGQSGQDLLSGQVYLVQEQPGVGFQAGLDYSLGETEALGLRGRLEGVEEV